MIVAGGSSTRFGSDKLMADIEGRPLISYTVEAVQAHVGRIVIACRPELIDTVAELHPDVTVTPGGSTRTLSEMAGLAALGEEYDLVGIHDAARPILRGILVDRLFRIAARSGGAIPVLEPEGLLIGRTGLTPAPDVRRVQTPQVFRAPDLMAAYVRAAQTGFEGLDTSDVMQEFSDVTIVGMPGDRTNLKVTYPDDLELVRERIRARSRT